jgi:hypothetical protein
VRRALAALGCAAAVLGCQRAKLVTGQPHAAVSPVLLDLGSTPVLFPVRGSVLVQSVGLVPLHVSGVRIEDDAAHAFAVSGDDHVVLPGASLELVVIFRPPAHADYAATLRFETNDELGPAFAILLTGTGTIEAALAVRPAALDFGRVGEGQTAARELTLSSVGAADLYLASLDFAPGTPDGFALLGSAIVPATLPAGQSVTLAVRYSPPPGTLPAPGALRIGSSDPQKPLLDVPLVASLNRAPIALARGVLGQDPPREGPIDVPVGATVGLDATGSQDPDGDLPLRYAWSLPLLPQGSAAAIVDASAAQTSIQLDAPGSYSLLLSVIDSTGLPSAQPSRLDLRALPPDQLLVELIWDKVLPDLDLHFVVDGQARNTIWDCNWANPDPAWFGDNPDLNPHHHGDKLTGYGPEEVSWKQPADGVYRLDVVYKADHGATDPSTTATVRVFAFGEQIADLRHAFAKQGEVWTAGKIDWPQVRVEVTP